MARLERDGCVEKGLYAREPVFYCAAPDGAVFYGNSIHNLLEESGLKKEFNKKMVPTYLRYWYPAGSGTFYRGIKRLLPGQRLVSRNGVAQAESFETLQFAETCPYSDKESVIADLRRILADIFAEERKACDTTFLSSGIDSSMLASGLPAKQTITVGYDDDRYDESREAEGIAERIGTQIHVGRIDAKTYFDVLPEALAVREEPTGDSSYLSLYLAAREAAKHTNACCSGEGLDELFCGYRCYKDYLNSQTLDLDYWIIGHTCMKTFGTTRETSALMAGYADGFERLQAFDLLFSTECNLLPNLLAAGKGNSIEIRSPFIDRRLLELAVSIPAEFKVEGERDKIVLREAAELFLPKDIAHKPKRAFPVPTQAWMREEPWAGAIRDAFDSPAARKLLNGFVPRRYLRKYFTESADTKATSSYWHAAWTMYALLVWYNKEFGPVR